MFNKAWNVHFALVLSRLSKIIRRLHSQPHVGAATKSLFKAQRHLGPDRSSAQYHVVKLLARDLHGFRRHRHTDVQFVQVALASVPG